MDKLFVSFQAENTLGRGRTLLLIVANIGFGLFQAGLPPASPLRLYPGWGNGFGGVLVSVNHQATALIIGMLLSLGLWARTRAHRQSPWWQRLVYPLIALVCLFAIPLTGSRAGMVLALAMLKVSTVLKRGKRSSRPSSSSRSKSRWTTRTMWTMILGCCGMEPRIGEIVNNPYQNRVIGNFTGVAFLIPLR